MPIISIKNISKSYSNGEKTSEFSVLEGVNIDIEENQFVSLVGPSGCGKSTLLRIVAGLETKTSGEVFYKKQLQEKPRSEIGMVFQNYSLMPWLNARQNIMLGLDFKGVSKKEKEEIVAHYLAVIGMKDFGRAMPHELSGGMQQRVAIARTLASNPDVVLMDEPFGALDAYTRMLLQKELLNIWEKDKKTIIFVTHSVDEAIYLSDRIILMSKDKGKIFRDEKIDMMRPRDRSNPLYGQLTEEFFADLERVNREFVYKN